MALAALAAIAGGAQVASGFLSYQASQDAADAATSNANLASFYSELAAGFAQDIGALNSQLVREQADILLAESELEVAFREKFNKAAIASAKMSSLASGFDLSGSPLIALQDAIQTTEIELEAYKTSADIRAQILYAQADIMDMETEAKVFEYRTNAGLASEEAAARASAYESQGLASLISSVGSAAMSAYSINAAGSSAGSSAGGGTA